MGGKKCALAELPVCRFDDYVNGGEIPPEGIFLNKKTSKFKASGRGNGFLLGGPCYNLPPIFAPTGNACQSISLDSFPIK